MTASSWNSTSQATDWNKLFRRAPDRAGLFCGSQHPTLAAPLTTCAPSQYGSKLISIPAPGTENDDHNPPRIQPKSLFDLSVGDDNLLHGDKYRWSAQFTVINLANNYALYNFL